MGRSLPLCDVYICRRAFAFWDDCKSLGKWRGSCPDLTCTKARDAQWKVLDLDRLENVRFTEGAGINLGEFKSRALMHLVNIT